MSTNSGTELLALLGSPLESALIQKLLQELGVTPVLEFGGRGPAMDATIPSLGLDITFKPTASLRDGDAFGQSPTALVTAVFFFHAAGFDRYAGYPGALPYGLHFEQSRAAVRSLLGEPSGSSLRYKNDRWNLEPRYLTVDFSDDEQRIKLVTVGLPWKPRTPS
ncbi:MAG TPA: hypothetical protein VER12_03055 [Polyangiaceae bacterium]|nr:hypothetical protein [Polyangiaceae bacterium]